MSNGFDAFMAAYEPIATRYQAQYKKQAESMAGMMDLLKETGETSVIDAVYKATRTATLKQMQDMGILEPLPEPMYHVLYTKLCMYVVVGQTVSGTMITTRLQHAYR